MTGYIGVPIETDPSELSAEALDTLMEVLPGFVPREGHLEVWLVEVWARMVAEARDVASSVPTTIFRYFGESLMGIAPVAGAPASTTVTITAVDAQGYTIPADTSVAFRTAGDELVPFRVVADAVISPGSTSVSGIAVEALEDGVIGNGLGPGAVELVDALAFVNTITSAAATSGGVDPETDEAYLDRLTAELQLLAPRPILAQDFAVLARRVSGVYRALAIDGYNPGLNETQTVTVTSATGGTFTLTFEGQTTAAIAYNATAATVQAALEALSNIAPGDIVVTGGPLSTSAVTVEFTGALKSSDRTQMTANGAALTGAGAAVSIATTRQGVAPTTNNERMVTVALVDSLGNAVSQAVKTATQTDLDARREVNFVVHVTDPTYTVVNVTFAATALSTFDLADVDSRAEAAVRAYLSPATWGGGAESPPEWRTNSNTVRYLELAQVINAVDGVDYIQSLTVNGGTADLPLTGVAPLPQVGTVTGTVTYG